MDRWIMANWKKYHPPVHILRQYSNIIKTTNISFKKEILKLQMYINTHDFNSYHKWQAHETKQCFPHPPPAYQ